MTLRYPIECIAGGIALIVLCSACCGAVVGSRTASAGAKPSAHRSRDEAESSRSLLMYIGTYTYRSSRGIYVARFDPSTGELSEPELAAATSNPSFLAIRPDGRSLYAVNEQEEFHGQKTGGITAFEIDPASGRLTQLDEKPSGGGAPCHVLVDRSGKLVFVANYDGGSVAVFKIERNGSLGERVALFQFSGKGANPHRQEAPHAHCVTLTPDNRFAYMADLGRDRIAIYRCRSHDLAPEASVAPGAGPRHVAIHPNGKFAYVTNELGNTITAFDLDRETGALTEIQTIPTLPEGWHGVSTTAEIVVSPDGRFVYDSNRGHNSIAIFSIDASSGRLTPVGFEPTQGKTPRGFTIDPTGNFLIVANQDSDNIVVFRIDHRSGKLTPTGSSIKVSLPSSLVFHR
jgi:6-phosphogluconolactonase